MIIRRINIISFAALVCLLVFGYGRIGYNVHLIGTCILLVIFISATILDFLLTSERKPASSPTLVAIVSLFMGFVTSSIVGSQTHDERDGGPSFGMALWPIVLDLIFPITFSIFVLSLSYWKRAAQRAALFAWMVVTIIIGYAFDNFHPSNDSEYFPSETKIVTPLLVGIVLFWTVWIFVKWKWDNGRTQ